MTRPTVFQIQQKLQSFDWSALENPGRNKGTRGQALELALGIPNSPELQDLDDGELKTYTIGESIACTQLLHCLPEIFDHTPFNESKLGKKMKHTIYIGFSRDYQYKGTITLNNDTHTEHYIKLEEDYKFICNKIIEALYSMTELNTITGPNKLLQIRTKDSKRKDGTYKPLLFNNHILKNKGMAFYLCPQFGKELLI
tara:strand:+ start:349 stop:942 length:594 start_codon:yes stop_codon:yes gene_type:complete